jgi:hypothetical protein
MSALLVVTHLNRLRLPEENWAEVGTMDLRMAHGARLVFCGLIVSWSGRRSRSAVHVRRMTAQAKKVDVVYLEHPWIG